MNKKRMPVVVFSLAVVIVFCVSCGSLWRSTLKGDAYSVKYYAEQGEDLEQTDKYGWTPLMWACYYQYFEVVDVLLEKGANPNAKSQYRYGSINDGSTPLTIAAYYGWSSGVRALLRFGANKNIPDSMGQTPLKVAEKYNFNEIIELMNKGVGPVVVVKKTKPAPTPTPEAEMNQIIIMTDGSKIVGKIISQSRTQVVVQTKYNTMTLEKDKISEMKYK